MEPLFPGRTQGASYQTLNQKKPRVRNFSARNSGAQLAAPILWAPGIFWFFLQENRHAPKIPRFRGGLGFFFWKGGQVPILFFMGVGTFPIENNSVENVLVRAPKVFFLKKNSASSKPTRICTALFKWGEMTQIKHTQICSLTPGQDQPYRNKRTQFVPSRCGCPPWLCKFGRVWSLLKTIVSCR